MSLDIINKLKFKIQTYIILLYCKYSYIFCSSKPFEEDLTTRKKNKKKIEIKKVEINKQNLDQKKIEIEKTVEKEVKKEKEKEINKTIDNEDINNKPIEQFVEEPIEEPTEPPIEEPINNEENNNINKKLKDTLDSLNYENINNINLEFYKKIFYEILIKCREKVLFFCNNKIFSDFKNLKTYNNTYIKISNIYDILDNIDEDNYKIKGENVYVENSITEKEIKKNGIEIFKIKDPVYNFIYSIRCNIEENKEKDYLNNNPFYVKNDGFKEKYKCKNKLYFYLNEQEEENNEKINKTRYIIFFNYLLFLLDESEIYCSKIDTKQEKFFIENKLEMDVLTSVGFKKNNTLTINKDAKIIRGIIDNN